MPPIPSNPLPNFEWPYLLAVQRLALALGLGLFVGLERHRSGKEAGMRTFAFAALLGCQGGLLGESFALVSLALLGVLVVLLNVHTMRSENKMELTTSASLLVMGFIGVLCGLGHTLTPTALGVTTAALLAWKGPMSGFSLGLTDTELRSAILLAILAFVIYPGLPDGAVDPCPKQQLPNRRHNQRFTRQNLLQAHLVPWNPVLRSIYRTFSRSHVPCRAYLLRNSAAQSPEDAVPEVASETAGLFQRSSSSVEGRNGRLSLQHHGHSRVSEQRLKALTVIHNYMVKRPDGTTAAERFFGQKHKDVFSWLVEQMPDLPRPAAKRTKKADPLSVPPG